ncbi:MAG: hypothetical protein R6V62_11610 [Candidatus Fermentibacteraceae bacterium]
MNSLRSGNGKLEEMVDFLLTESVSSQTISEGTARMIALKAQILRKPAFPLYRIAVIVVAAALAALFAASNVDRLSWLCDLASLKPFESLVNSLASISFERAAAALAVTGGLVYTVYTIAFPRAR